MLAIDAQAEAARIEAAIREITLHQLKRRGIVVGVSGGIDSSVTATLCARALGPERVIALLMPERESSPDSLRLGKELAEHIGIRHLVEDVTSVLDAAGCYRRRDEAIRTVVPEYGAGYTCKIVLPDVTQGTIPIFSVVVQSPGGEVRRARLTADAYLGVLAASNFKQRVRKMMEYHYADLLQYAVAGTPNRLEYELGFFVKLGDGAADLKPIAHLYKSQVFKLAEYLGVPDEIRRRPPTTDTYSMEQSQEEFYFSVSLDKMDVCLYGSDHQIPAALLAPDVGLSEAEVTRVYKSIDSKRRMAQYLHATPVII
jgi:NAD+ synthase